MMRRTCAHQDPLGRHCQATPQRDRPFCFWHDPERQEDAAEARRLGGLRRKREHTVAGAYDLHGLDLLDQARRYLEIAGLDSLALDNSIARNRLLTTVALALLRLLDVTDLESRLAALEQATSHQALPTPIFDVDLDGDVDPEELP